MHLNLGNKGPICMLAIKTLSVIVTVLVSTVSAQTNLPEIPKVFKNLKDLPKCKGAVINWNNCFGTFQLSNSVHIGEFHNGKANGQGLRVGTKKGDKYFGDFKNGRTDGEGTYTRLDGFYYTGAWKQGKRHGFGNAFFPDGRQYLGMWAYNGFQGDGILFNKTGKVLSEGVFEKNVLIKEKIVEFNFKKSADTANLEQSDKSEIAVNLDTPITKDLKIIQTLLASLGFYKTTIDGKWGASTYNALINALKEGASNNTKIGDYSDLEKTLQDLNSTLRLRNDKLREKVSAQSEKILELQKLKLAKNSIEKASPGTQPKEEKIIALKGVNLNMGQAEIENVLSKKDYKCNNKVNSFKEAKVYKICENGDSKITISNNSLKFSCQNFNICKLKINEAVEKFVEFQIINTLVDQKTEPVKFCGTGANNHRLCLTYNYFFENHLEMGILDPGGIEVLLQKNTNTPGTVNFN